MQVYLYSFLNLTGVGWSAPCSGTDTRYTFIREVDCVPGLAWTVAKNLAPRGFRSTDLPARGESLSRPAVTHPPFPECS